MTYIGNSLISSSLGHHDSCWLSFHLLLVDPGSELEPEKEVRVEGGDDGTFNTGMLKSKTTECFFTPRVNLQQAQTACDKLLIWQNTVYITDLCLEKHPETCVYNHLKLEFTDDYKTH